jgi:hypothetical protein
MRRLERRDRRQASLPGLHAAVLFAAKPAGGGA